MDNYLERFRAMVEELWGHPDVVVTHFSEFPPVTERTILRTQHEFGAEIPEEFLKFYQRSNGMQLRWLYRGDAHFEKGMNAGMAYTGLSYESVYRDNGMVAGCINLQPLQKVFGHNADWEGIVHFESSDNGHERWDGTSYPTGEFRRSLRPIDYYHFYYSVLVLTIDKSRDLPLLTSSGYFKNLHQIQIDGFSGYLEFLLESRGLIEARNYMDVFCSTHPSIARAGKRSDSIGLVEILAMRNRGELEI